MSDDFQYYVGLDLGQVQDFSALVVAEKTQLSPPTFAVPSIHRYPLRTPYTQIVEEVRAALAAPPLVGKTALLVDGTGVGKAVVDIFRGASLAAPLYTVTITGGEHASREGDDFRVPKRDLAGVVAVLFEQARIKIAEKLPLADVFKRELKEFSVKINPKTAHDAYEAWRENAHDDLVLAAALALWGGGQRLTRKKTLEGYTAPPAAPLPAGYTVRQISPSMQEIRGPAPPTHWARARWGILEVGMQTEVERATEELEQVIAAEQDRSFRESVMEHVSNAVARLFSKSKENAADAETLPPGEERVEVVDATEALKALGEAFKKACAALEQRYTGYAGDLTQLEAHLALLLRSQAQLHQRLEQARAQRLAGWTHRVSPRGH